jgi:Fe-S-cluster containining protein
VKFWEMMLPPHQQATVDKARTEALRLSRDEFRESEHPALAIGQILHQSLDYMTTASKKHWACKSGCSMCCYEPVTVSEPEAIYMARVLRDSATDEEITLVIDELRRVTDRTSGIPDRVTWHRARVRCPFLHDFNGSCTIYDVRPANCRAHNSLKVKDCEEQVEDPHKNVRTDVSAYLAYASLVNGIRDAVFERGGSFRNLEMVSAVLCALETPDAGPRWVAGEDVFKDCVPAVRDWKPA